MFSEKWRLSLDYVIEYTAYLNTVQGILFVYGTVWRCECITSYPIILHTTALRAQRLLTLSCTPLLSYFKRNVTYCLYDDCTHRLDWADYGTQRYRAYIWRRLLIHCQRGVHTLLWFHTCYSFCNTWYNEQHQTLPALPTLLMQFLRYFHLFSQRTLVQWLLV